MPSAGQHTDAVIHGTMPTIKAVGQVGLGGRLYLAVEKLISKLTEYGESGTRFHLVYLLLATSFHLNTPTPSFTARCLVSKRLAKLVLEGGYLYLAAERLITKLSEYGESGIRLHLHLVSLLLVSSCSSPTRYDTSIPPAIKPEKCTMGGEGEEDDDVGVEGGKAERKGKKRSGWLMGMGY